MGGGREMPSSSSNPPYPYSQGEYSLSFCKALANLCPPRVTIARLPQCQKPKKPKRWSFVAVTAPRDVRHWQLHLPTALVPTCRFPQQHTEGLYVRNSSLLGIAGDTAMPSSRFTPPLRRSSFFLTKQPMTARSLVASQLADVT